MRRWSGPKSLVAFPAVALGLLAVLQSTRVPVTHPSHPGMVLVGAGPFIMGSTGEQAEAAYRAYGGSVTYYQPEVPRRMVTLASLLDRPYEGDQRELLRLRCRHRPPSSR